MIDPGAILAISLLLIVLAIVVPMFHLIAQRERKENDLES